MSPPDYNIVGAASSTRLAGSHVLHADSAETISQGSTALDVCAVTERPSTVAAPCAPQVRVLSSAQQRTSAAWLRAQLSTLRSVLNGLAPEDRDNAIANILSGVAWRGGE